MCDIVMTEKRKEVSLAYQGLFFFSFFIFFFWF